MTNTRKAMQMALEALEETLRVLDDANATPGGPISDTIWYSEYETLFDYLTSEIQALRTELARVQEPAPGYKVVPPNASGEANCTVRWMIETDLGWVGAYDKEVLTNLLAAAPQAPERKPLTDEQVMEMVFAECDNMRWPSTAIYIARAIERAHGIGELQAPNPDTRKVVEQMVDALEAAIAAGQKLLEVLP